MLPETKEILMRFDYIQQSQHCYRKIIKIIKIARLTRKDILEIDNWMLWSFSRGWSSSIQEVFDSFIEICILNSNRPDNYWFYLFSQCDLLV